MCNFAARPGWRRCCSSAVGASEARADPAVLELLWAEVAQSGVETACVVDFVDESRKILCDVDAQGRSRLPDSIRNLRITPGSQSNPQPDYCPAQGVHSMCESEVMGQTVCVLPPTDQRLLAIVADRNRPLKHVQRAHIVLCSADRLPVQEVARRADVSRPSVWRWQARDTLSRASMACCATRRASPVELRFRPGSSLRLWT